MDTWSGLFLFVCLKCRSRRKGKRTIKGATLEERYIFVCVSIWVGLLRRWLETSRCNSAPLVCYGSETCIFPCHGDENSRHCGDSHLKRKYLMRTGASPTLKPADGTSTQETSLKLVPFPPPKKLAMDEVWLTDRHTLISFIGSAMVAMSSVAMLPLYATPRIGA